jgi:signal peptidase I
MKKRSFTLIMLFCLLSCNIHHGRQSTESMEPTIKKDEIILIKKPRKISRNQIIAFNHMDSLYGESMFVFRAVGIPGDKIEMEEGTLYVNGSLNQGEWDLRIPHMVTTKGPLVQKAIEKFQYQQVDSNHYIFHLSNEEKYNLSQYSDVIAVEINYMNPGKYQENLFFPDTLNNWNADNFGPILVPEGSYFVLGDNRHDAFDSRYIGYVSESDIVGIINK